MNIIVKCTLAACALLFSGSTLSAAYDQCGVFNNRGEIVPYNRPVVEKCCCTKPCPPCPKPYCPPPRVICYSCPSCPEYAAYWEKQDAAMTGDVNNVRGAPSPVQADQWESKGFNDNGRMMNRYMNKNDNQSVNSEMDNRDNGMNNNMNRDMNMNRGMNNNMNMNNMNK